MGSDNCTMSKPGNAKWLHEARPNGTFIVRRPDGTIYCTCATLSQAAATAGTRQKEADQAARRMTRTCMCCRHPFESEGIHNRLCSRCRHASADGWSPYGLAPRSGRPR